MDKDFTSQPVMKIRGIKCFNSQYKHKLIQPNYTPKGSELVVSLFFEKFD